MNLLRSLATVSSMTLLSRILGFARDFVIARTFGAGMATDAFFVAFKLPNLLRRLFAEGAFSQAFVPVLAEYRNQRSPEDTRTLIDRVTALLALILIAITLIGIMGAPLLVYLSAPGFLKNTAQFDLTVTLTRITFPYILCMSLVALSGGILNTWSRFAVPAFTPVLLNLSFIGMALWAAPLFAQPVHALAWAVALGGFLQLAFQLPALAQIGLLPRPWGQFSAAFHDPGVRRILTLMAPAILGVSVSQVSLLLNTLFASFLATGSVSWLYYADRLMEFPAGLLGAALGTILLPSLARAHAQEQSSTYSSLLDWGLRLTFLLAAPASLALALLAVPLISTLFQYGAFSANDVLMTRNALWGYAVGLTALILIKVLAPGFYARQNVRTPVKIAVTALITTQILNLVFVFVFPLGHAGLALSISLAALLNATLLYRGLRQQQVYHPQPGWGKFLLKLALALAVMGLLLTFLAGDAALWQKAHGMERLVRLSGIVAAGMISYFATLALLGFRLRHFRQGS